MAAPTGRAGRTRDLFNPLTPVKSLIPYKKNDVLWDALLSGYLLLLFVNNAKLNVKEVNI